MHMFALAPLPTEELHPHRLVESQSESGRWRLVTRSEPERGAAISLWLEGNTPSEPHGLVRRWRLPGPQAAKRFHALLCRKLGELPEDASPSMVLGHLPMKVDLPASRHTRWRGGIPPVQRLSGA